MVMVMEMLPLVFKLVQRPQDMLQAIQIVMIQMLTYIPVLQKYVMARIIIATGKQMKV